MDAQQRAQSYKEEGGDPWRWGRNTTDADGGKSKEWGAEGRRRGEDVGEASPLADGPATSWRKLWRMPQIGIERRLPRRGILANRVPGSDKLRAVAVRLGAVVGGAAVERGMERGGEGVDHSQRHLERAEAVGDNGPC